MVSKMQRKVSRRLQKSCRVSIHNQPLQRQPAPTAYYSVVNETHADKDAYREKFFMYSKLRLNLNQGQSEIR